MIHHSQSVVDVPSGFYGQGIGSEKYNCHKSGILKNSDEGFYEWEKSGHWLENTRAARDELLKQYGNSGPEERVYFIQHTHPSLRLSLYDLLTEEEKDQYE